MAATVVAPAGRIAPARVPERDDEDFLPWHLHALGVPQVWREAGALGAGVRVAVVDTGVASVHGLDRGGISHFDSAGRRSAAGDAHGHGTMCASLIACNEIDAMGIVPEVELVSIRAATSRGELSERAVLRAFDVAEREACDVVSCSFVLRRASRSLLDAVERMRGAGRFIVGAAGRRTDPPSGFPERTPYCLAVAAVDRLGRPLAGARSGPWIDIAAPGEGLFVVTNSGRIYRGFGESSAACALVSGIVALMIAAARRKDAYSAVASVLLAEIANTARDLGLPGPDDATGYGIIDPSGLYARLAPRMG